MLLNPKNFPKLASDPSLSIGSLIYAVEVGLRVFKAMQFSHLESIRIINVIPETLRFLLRRQLFE